MGTLPREIATFPLTGGFSVGAGSFGLHVRFQRRKEYISLCVLEGGVLGEVEAGQDVQQDVSQCRADMVFVLRRMIVLKDQRSHGAHVKNIISRFYAAHPSRGRRRRAADHDYCGIVLNIALMVNYENTRFSWPAG